MQAAVVGSDIAGFVERTVAGHHLGLAVAAVLAVGSHFAFAVNEGTSFVLVAPAVLFVVASLVVQTADSGLEIFEALVAEDIVVTAASAEEFAAAALVVVDKVVPGAVVEARADVHPVA